MRLPVLALVIASLPAAAAAQQPVQPGQWEIATTVNSMEMPDMPPAVAAMMKGRVTRIKHCITQAEAAQGPQEMLKSSKSCRFNRYSAVGGKLSSEMVCSQGKSQMTTTVTGTYTPTSFSYSGQTVGSGDTPMRISSSAIGRRIGDCSK